MRRRRILRWRHALARRLCRISEETDAQGCRLALWVDRLAMRVGGVWS